MEVTCTKAVCPEVLGVRRFQTSFVLPAELMDVCLFVEVVAVLADVVQGGVDGRVIPAPALIRHPSIPLATSHKIQQS